jgi:hypothetical protein
VGQGSFKPIDVGQSPPKAGSHGWMNPIRGVTAEQSEQGPSVPGGEGSTWVRPSKAG